MTDTTTAPKRNGWSAFHARKRQDERDKQEIVAGLLRDLGREPTTTDRLDAETKADMHIDARRLERQGKYAEAREVRNAIIRANRASGFKSRPPAPEKKPDIDALFREIAENPAGGA